MAVTKSSQKAFASGVTQRSSGPVRSRAVRVSCHKQGDLNVQSVAAAVAAAALLSATPASARVIIEQPALKKLFQDDAPAAPAPKKSYTNLPGLRKAAPSASAPATKAAPAAVSETSGGDLDPRLIALPASLAAIVGISFALSKVDADWNSFLDTAAAKNSVDLGAGYEVAIKEGIVGGAGKNGSRPNPSKSTGTKKVKAATKAAAKAVGTGSTNPLSSLFGK
eukprot:jgi/Chrzof1/11959/Cz06g16040.t1_PETO[v5.2]